VAGIAVFALAGLGCSALLPLTISFGEGDLTAMAAAMAGGVVAFYQLGYGIAAFGVGPLLDAGVSLVQRQAARRVDRRRPVPVGRGAQPRRGHRPRGDPEPGAPGPARGRDRPFLSPAPRLPGDAAPAGAMR
jgi:hypothetical protein